jgi:small-conductance mechanosensitive channel
MDMGLLERELYGGTIGAWLLVAGAVVVGFAILRGLQAVVLGRLASIAKRTTTQWDDIVLYCLRSTKALFLLLLALFAAGSLILPAAPVQPLLGKLLVLAFFVQGGIWFSAGLKAWLDSYRESRLSTDAAAVTTMQAAGFVARILVWAVVLLLALDNLGVQITALVAGLGIGGIAIALAVQNILGDLFASLSIVLDKPFVIGDFLIVDTYLGAVEHVGLKTTRLRSLSGEQLIFSNADLLQSRVRNFGRMFERRVVFSIGVTYQTPREKLKAIPGILRAAVEAQEKTRFDRSHFKDFGDYSLNFETVYYVLAPDYGIYMDIQQAINLRVHEEFEREGIEFAYPTQVVHVVGSGENG